MQRIPLCQIAWEIADKRCKSGFYNGLSIFDGKYRSSWDFYKLPQRLALVSSLAYLKGGANELPPGLMIPMTTDGRYLKHYIPDVLHESRRQIETIKHHIDHESGKTILNKQRYDVLCPLPSSRGPPSEANVVIAHIIARSLGDSLGGDSGPPVESLFKRHSAMITKSTRTPRSDRKDPDAPRLMHFDTISIGKEFLASIKGKSILLYDDVVTWGNTSEAARNMLLLAGAAEVDIISCMATGDLMRVADYEYVDSDRLSLGECLVAEAPKIDKFRLRRSRLVSKEILNWKQQPDIKTWHRLFGEWIEDRFPELIPNDIPDI